MRSRTALILLAVCEGCAGTSPTPNLIAGNPRCLLAVKTKPRNSMFIQGNLSYLDSDIILNWIVNYSARP